MFSWSGNKVTRLFALGPHRADRFHRRRVPWVTLVFTERGIAGSIRCFNNRLISYLSAIEFYTQKKVTSAIFLPCILVMTLRFYRRRQAFGSRRMLSPAGHPSICLPITNSSMQRSRCIKASCSRHSFCCETHVSRHQSTWLCLYVLNCSHVPTRACNIIVRGFLQCTA
jgi:hypothetical protein